MSSRVFQLGPLAFGADHPARVMAIVNVSPESFYAGSVATGRDAVRRAAEEAERDGADVLDIGARSTAPYKETGVSVEVEAERMGLAVAAAREACGLPISADTMHATVAAVALDAGACIVNDVSGFEEDAAMGVLAADRGCGVVLMAREERGAPAGGRSPVGLVRERLEQALARADAAGVARERIVLDPGIGFFRNTGLAWHAFDMEVLAHLDALRVEGHPLLVSASRKSFLGPVLGRSDAGDRLGGSLAAAAWAALHGAAIIRTHDVAATRDVVRLVAALREERKAH
jgi:dihydropteroate synthase